MLYLIIFVWRIDLAPYSGSLITCRYVSWKTSKIFINRINMEQPFVTITKVVKPIQQLVNSWSFLQIVLVTAIYYNFCVFPFPLHITQCNLKCYLRALQSHNVGFKLVWIHMHGSATFSMTYKNTFNQNFI